MKGKTFTFFVFTYFHNNTDQNLKQTQEMMALLIKFKPIQGFDFVLQNIQMVR